MGYRRKVRGLAVLNGFGAQPHWLVFLLNQLQSVLDASAQSVTCLCCSAHITDTLASFLWIRAPVRIKFKLAVIVYRDLHNTAPQYLSDTLSRVADISSQSRLRLSTSSQLMDCSSRLITVAECSFTSAGPRLWNRHSCNGRVIGNHVVWPIDWQQHQWPWATLKVTLAVWNLSKSHTLGMQQVLTMRWLHVNRKVCVACNYDRPM